MNFLKAFGKNSAAENLLSELKTSGVHKKVTISIQSKRKI